jgi:transposase
MLGVYDVSRDRLYGHVKKRKTRVEFLAFCRYIRSLYPPETRLHFILDNFSLHLGETVREWAAKHNADLAYTPHYGSWLNRIDASSRRCATSPSTAPTTRPRHPGPAHPPLHRMAQRPRRRHQATRRPYHGKRCLTLH